MRDLGSQAPWVLEQCLLGEGKFKECDADRVNAVQAGWKGMPEGVKVTGGGGCRKGSKGGERGGDWMGKSEGGPGGGWSGFGVGWGINLMEQKAI